MRKCVGEKYDCKDCHGYIAYLHQGRISEISYTAWVNIVYTGYGSERRKSGRDQIKQGQKKAYPVSSFFGVIHKNDLAISFFINIVQ
jgi:hypothetical protein